MNKLVNGEVIPMTAKEVSDRQAEEAAWEASKITRDAEASKTDAVRIVEKIKSDAVALSLLKTELFRN